MSDYLDDLGHEIDEAVGRRLAGHRPSRWHVPATLAVLIAFVIVGVAAVAVVSGTGVDRERSAAADPSAVRPAALADIPAPPPELVDVPVIVANGTRATGLAAAYAQGLRNAGWTVQSVTNAFRSDLEASFVAGMDAEAAAQVLGLDVRESDALGRDLGLEDGVLAIAVGLDVARSSGGDTAAVDRTIERFAVLRDPARRIELPAGLPRTSSDLGDPAQIQAFLVRDDPRGKLYFAISGAGTCLFVQVASGPGGGGCGEHHAPFLKGHSAPGFSPIRAWAMVPDGTRDAEIEYQDGTVAPVPIRDNAVLVEYARPPLALSWTAPDGSRQRFRIDALSGPAESGVAAKERGAGE